MTPDLVVVGAGVVGLACAAEAAGLGHAVLVVERHDSFGRETSSRSSEVIHSGIYYTPGSLKARLCVAANRALYAYCGREGVWTRRCGKLVVAVDGAEVRALEEIHRRGETNGVEGLRMLEAREARALEPEIACVAALQVPSTGIVDSHELMRSYLRRATAGGADVAWRTSLVAAEPLAGGGYRLLLREPGGRRTPVDCRWVVNAAGNAGDDVAALFGIDIDAAGYRLHPNRGHYFRLAPGRAAPVSRLVYPVPPPTLAGIGVHITIDRANRVRFGPDAEYIDPSLPQSEWYRFDESRRDRFFEAVSRYYPALRPEDLSPDQVGVRPKLQKPGEGPRDFVVAEESGRGLPGLVNLIGIESPGLTCAAEIARLVFAELLPGHSAA